MLMDLLSPEIRLNPYPMYAMMRETAPVFYYPDNDLWLVFRYDDVRTVLSDQKHFSSQHGLVRPDRENDQVMGNSMVSQDPSRHTKLRGLVSKAFTPKAIADLEGRIREVTHQLLDAVIERGEMELTEDLTIPLPVVVIAEMLGVHPKDRVQFKAWSDHVIASADSFVTGKVEPEHQQAMEEMYTYFRGVMAERQQNPQHDLISQLLQVEMDGQRLTPEEVLAFCWLLLVGGNETTTSLLGNTLRTLLEHPDVMARLRAQPELIPQALEEVLRYRSPAQSMFRVVKEEITLGGQTLQPGQRVVALIGSANRDPAMFPEPDKFDIDRNPNPHIAFGHGVHFCLGAPLARLEGKVVLQAVLERLQDLERANDEPLEPMRGVLVMGPARLPLRFRPGPRFS